MSLALLEKVKAHITDAGFHTGYEDKYFRWTDESVNGKTPFILYRHPGPGGRRNVLMQETDVQILLVASPTTVVTAAALMHNILRLFIGSTTQTGVARFDPLGGVVGPFYLENGRPVFQLDIRCITEDQ